MRDESDDFLGFVLFYLPSPFSFQLFGLSCLTALTAGPTPSNKSPLTSPHCVPVSLCHSQCSVSLLDGTNPTETS